MSEPLQPELVRPLPEDDLRALLEARRQLESPSLAARVTALLGTPIERGMELLPAGWQTTIQRATRSALERALDVALATLEPSQPEVRLEASKRFHRLAAGLSGAAGGAFGLAALPVELPISTVVMLRGVADIARAEGEDLGCLETRLACLEVFALGGRGREDDAAETGYFAVRAALGKAVSEAAAYAAGRAATREGAPALARLVALIAERFGVVVGEKAAASFVPVVGALGGAAINVVFIDHFTEVARGHFTVRRLERLHGSAAVRAAWAAR